MRSYLLIKRARTMRKAPTKAEVTLWRWLRDRQFASFKFRRQHPIGGYIADFYCAAAKLVIELDGEQHGNFYDVIRDCELSKLGVRVMRIRNEELREKERVAEWIWEALKEGVRRK